MRPEELITGLQHIGIPTSNIEKTCRFYEQFGFHTDWASENRHLIFLKNGDCVLEVYQSSNTTGYDGGIDHIALHVTDIEEAYRYVTSLGYDAIEGMVCSNDAYDNGSSYFTIYGPNHEKVEFARLI
ncbi:VOC family protein [Porcincola intestinalis]|nr:VOC family protein [Porcincola intestinalis]